MTAKSMAEAISDFHQKAREEAVAWCQYYAAVTDSTRKPEYDLSPLKIAHQKAERALQDAVNELDRMGVEIEHPRQ